MNVWILTTKRAMNNYSNTRFRDVAQREGVNLTFVAHEDCEIIATREGRKSVYIKNEQIQKLPDCLIPRGGSTKEYFGRSVIRHLERLGVFVLNESSAIELARDKLATVQALAANNIPIPKTMLAKLPLNADVVGTEFTYPVVAKTLSGYGGKGIMLCENQNQLSDLVELIPDASNMIIQEFIATSAGRDIRVIVIGGRAIGAMLRTSKNGSFKANYSSGGDVEPYELTQELEWLSVESARLIGLDIAGVDILFGEDGHLYVCEVNSSPGIEGFEKATDIDVPKAVFDYVRLRLEGV